jgi:hypothetical protein
MLEAAKVDGRLHPCLGEQLAASIRNPFHRADAKALGIDPTEPRRNDHVTGLHVAATRLKFELETLGPATAYPTPHTAALGDRTDGTLPVEQQHGPPRTPGDRGQESNQPFLDHHGVPGPNSVASSLVE